MFKPLRNVVIAIPTRGKVSILLFSRIVHWKERGAEVIFSSAPFIDNARNKCVESFLKTKRDYLFFVDSDVIPDDDAIERLLKHKKDVIGGWYNLVLGPDMEGRTFQRPSSFETFLTYSNLSESKSITPNSGVKQVVILSGGFTLIHRKVLEAVGSPWFEIVWLGKDRSTFIGEDINFSVKAAKKGFELWCDTNNYAMHFKEMLI